MRGLARSLPLIGVVVLVVAWPSVANAICVTGIVYGQYGYYCPYHPGGTNWCYTISPGINTPQSIVASYWAFTFGDPVVGAGDDNGDLQDDEPAAGNPTGWLRLYPGAPGPYLTGTWADDQQIDGCINDKFAPGKSFEIQLVAFSDVSADNSKAFFAIAGARRDPAAPVAEINFSLMGVDIALVETPKPKIVNATCGAPGDCSTVNVEVECPPLSGGFYTDGTITASEAIRGCRIFKQIVTRGAAAPSTRDRSAWTDTAVLVSEGGTGTVGLNCTNDSDAYLATAVEFDSGFMTAHVSANSTRIECGPNLAEPPDVNFKVVPRPDKPKVKPDRN